MTNFAYNMICSYTCTHIVLQCSTSLKNFTSMCFKIIFFSKKKKKKNNFSYLIMTELHRILNVSQSLES